MAVVSLFERARKKSTQVQVSRLTGGLLAAHLYQIPYQIVNFQNRPINGSGSVAVAALNNLKIQLRRKGKTSLN